MSIQPYVDDKSAVKTPDIKISDTAKQRSQSTNNDESMSKSMGSTPLQIQRAFSVPKDTSPFSPPTASLLSRASRKMPSMSNIEQIIRITPTCFLRPKCFFVAWHSVITLVFNGWPEPIDTMKSELSSNASLCKEYFGSKFPKITLACVKDGVEMTPALLTEVRALCAQASIPKNFVLPLDSLSICLWENRSHESIIYEKTISLNKNHTFHGSPRPLLVNLEEDDMSSYVRSANRQSHYVSSIVGASVVHRLVHVPQFITELQSKLPKDIFYTFSKESLHVTVRALC